VDEIPQKKYLLHMLAATFLQVKAVQVAKIFFFPQAFTQAVHKVCPLLHSLSTALQVSRLCGWVAGG